MGWHPAETFARQRTGDQWQLVDHKHILANYFSDKVLISKTQKEFKKFNNKTISEEAGPQKRHFYKRFISLEESQTEGKSERRFIHCIILVPTREAGSFSHTGTKGPSAAPAQSWIGRRAAWTQTGHIWDAGDTGSSFTHYATMPALGVFQKLR